jgi:hypothetical protein
MINFQGTPTPPPPPPVPRVDGDAIARRIDEAINQALSQRQDGQEQNARQSIRDAKEEVQRAVQAARAEGRTVTIQPQFDAENIVPPQAVDISIAFFVMIAFIIVGLPLARALRGLPSANAAGGWPSGAREPERVPVGETSRRP